jgi:histone H3/H4
MSDIESTPAVVTETVAEVAATKPIKVVKAKVAKSNNKKRTISTRRHKKQENFNVLPRGRISKKLGPRAGVRRIESGVFADVQHYVNARITMLAQQAALLCRNAKRQTVTAEDVADAFSLSGGRYLL